MKFSSIIYVTFVLGLFIYSNSCISQDKTFSGIKDKEPLVFSPEKGYLKVFTFVEKKYDDGIFKHIYKPY
jgi:hypothetical protein